MLAQRLMGLQPFDDPGAQASPSRRPCRGRRESGERPSETTISGSSPLASSAGAMNERIRPLPLSPVFTLRTIPTNRLAENTAEPLKPLQSSSFGNWTSRALRSAAISSCE